jgi:hypothetical protein
MIGENVLTEERWGDFTCSHTGKRTHFLQQIVPYVDAVICFLFPVAPTLSKIMAIPAKCHLIGCYHRNVQSKELL